MKNTLHRLPILALLLVVAIPASRAVAQVGTSAWVYPSAAGDLLYQLDERGQRIADFSQCGYRGGIEPLPNVTAVIPQNRWVYLSPDGTADDTVRIQAAIDSVKAFTLDANGWRGVVYLNAGEYQLATTLKMNSASGVVLKGAGDDPVTGTRLRATGTVRYDLISANGSGDRTIVPDTTRNLTQKLVPAGTRTFQVDSTSGLAVGHTVIVKRPSTTNWIADIDMDQLAVVPGEPTQGPWTAGSKDILFDRVITRIEGNWITVDAPLPQTFELQYGGGQIWRYTWSGRMEQVGIEDIYAISDYVSPTDENHAWNFIYMSRTQHSWVRNITARHFVLSAVWLGTAGKWITVADSLCLDPISTVDGGRRYAFQTTDGELSLFVNNDSQEGRHDYSFGAVVPGPNVFVHGVADTALNDTGPHQRWAVGGLFDMLTINGDEINVRNRGNSGSGHGWAGAYMAVWNCKADGYRVRNPPTARNWLVGSIGTIQNSSGFSVGADPAGTYDSSGPSGTGKAVYPRSLYYGQLQQRMKSPDSEFRETWLGDVDQHSSTGGTGETVNCDPTWLTQVEALDALPAVAKFDQLAGNRYTAFTLDFSRDPGDTIVAASLTVSLRAIGSAATDKIWLDNTANPQTFASLGWAPISTTAPTVETMEVSPALLADGRLNVALGSNCAVDFAVLHLQVQKAQPSTSTIVLTPVADAYVQGGTNAGTNYGNLTSLVTKEDSNSSLTRETFLRWDLSGISGKIVQARVRLAGTSAAQIGNETCANFVSDDTWGETTITFANKPAAGKLFAQWLPVTGQAVEFTVTPQVVETLLDSAKLLSLRILSTDNFGANGNVSYASKENGTAANRPQLILTIENPPTAAIKAATGSALNVGTAWTPAFVPVNPDTATWNATSLAGTMTLGADLSWAGLIVNDPAAALTFNGTQFLSLGSGGIDMSAATVDLTLNHPVLLGENQTWNVGANRTLTATGQVSGPSSLTKTGAGNLILAGANTYTDSTTIDQGTLAFTTTDSSLAGGLVFGATAATTTAGILDLTPVNATFADALLVNTNSTTAHEIKIGAAQTLTINNNVKIGVTAPTVASNSNLTLTGGGTFNVATPAAGSFLVAGANGTTSRQEAILDLTALKATTLNTSTTGTLRVGPSTNNSNGKGTLLLPTPVLADTLATTTLTAATLAIGDGNSGGGTVNNITLGTGLTKLNADTINVGTGGRDVGQIIYGQAAGDLIIRAADGTSRAAAINVASLSGATANAQTSSVDFSGHDADILVTALNVGNQPRTGTLTTAFNFGQGDNSLTSKLEVTSVNIGLRPQTTTTTTVTHTARVNLSGGTVTFGDGTGAGVDIGNSAYFGSGTSSGSTVGELNISGGNVTINNSASLAAAVRLGTNVATGNATVTASMNLTGGTTTLGGDVIRNATSPRTTSTVRLSGGTLNMGGNDIGTATGAITFTTESGTLSNVKSINGTAGLTKTTANTLTITGTNTYSGATTVSNGALALSGTLTGALTVNSGTLAPLGLPATAGAFSLSSSSTYQTRINGATAGTLYDQLTASGSVTLSGPLNLVAGPGLSAGTSFRILNKTSAGAISGTFTGKPEGSVFTEDGYTWIISYLGGDGNDATLTLATALQAWRYTYFGTIANSGTAADTFDANGDGELNLLEFATAQNPTIPSLVTLSAARTASAVEVTYTRSNAALNGGMIFTVEWSDTLAPDSWSTAGVTQIPLTDNGTLQSIKATVPAILTVERRFARLKVSQP